MSNKTYDILKDIAQIWLPALATAFATIMGIWHLPYAEEIAGTIMAIDALLGAGLKVSTIRYNKKLNAEDK